MTTKTSDDKIKALFEVGAHFGYSKSRRNPSTAQFILGAKNGVEIINLEKTVEGLDRAKEFIKSVAQSGKSMLLVGGKKEAQTITRDAGEKLNVPYVAGRWIGGTLTNSGEIQKRISRYLDLLEQKEKNLLGKYTKKERLLIDREIVKLEERFKGLVPMKNKPGVLFVIDAGYEDIAVKEANKENIPVVALSSTDCDISTVNYPILANDSSIDSIKYFMNEIVSSYEEGVKSKKVGETK